MRILSLHSSYLSGPVSGENRVVKDEAKLLRSAGHKVEVWSPEPKASGVLPLVNTAIGMVWSRSAARYTRELIREFSPDVVHCHNLFPALSPAVINAANDFPVVMTLHNYRLACLPGTLFRDGQICELCLGGGIASGIRYACYRSSHTASATLGTSLMLHRKLGTFEKVSIFVAISEFLKSTMQRGGIARDRMIVKPHFAWPTPRRDGPGDYFLFMGRLVPEKGIEFLADLWDSSLDRLFVAGAGPLASKLQDSRTKGVEFLGALPWDELDGLVRNARALLVPSLWHEAAGKVVLEAYASGVPVVVADAGALPEVVVNGESGLVVPSQEPQGWRSAIKRLKEDSESLRMGSNAYELWSRRYSPAEGIRRLEEVYARAMDT